MGGKTKSPEAIARRRAYTREWYARNRDKQLAVHKARHKRDEALLTVEQRAERAARMRAAYHSNVPKRRESDRLRRLARKEARSEQHAALLAARDEQRAASLTLRDEARRLRDVQRKQDAALAKSAKAVSRPAFKQVPLGPNSVFALGGLL